MASANTTIPGSNQDQLLYKLKLVCPSFSAQANNQLLHQSIHELRWPSPLVRASLHLIRS